VGREENRIAETQQAWELARETQSAENRRQSDLISLHAENLEKRRDRLDRLRGELEQRHQELLETQISVDEAWAQLSQVTGDDNATERVNQAREQLADYCRSMRDGLNVQRREIDEAREQLEAQKEVFRSENQQQTDTAADRESQLRRREEHLDTVRSQLKEQADSWQHDRDAWLTERLEAERIIGQLLDEISRTGIPVPEEVLESQLPELPTLLGQTRSQADAA
jgi:chromosome segregation ATPase